MENVGYDVYVQYAFEEHPSVQHFNTLHSASVCAQLHAFDKWHKEQTLRCDQNIMSTTDCGKHNAYVLTNPDTGIERVRIWYEQTIWWKDKVHLVCIKKKGGTRVEYYKPLSVARIVAARYAGKWRKLNHTLAKEKGEVDIHDALQQELEWDFKKYRYHILNAETNEVMKVWVEEIKLNGVVMLE